MNKPKLTIVGVSGYRDGSERRFEETIEYGERQARIEFPVATPQSGQMQDDEAVVREFRQLLAALREVEDLPLEEILRGLH